MITIVGIVLQNEWSYDPCETSKMAERALDAILPQVTTVEELEALPVGTLLVNSVGGVIRVSHLPVGNPEIRGYRSDEYTGRDPSNFLDEKPLTVVWTP